MNRSHLPHLLACCSLLVPGCTSEPTSQNEPTVSVMTEIAFVRAEDGVSRGFDLDGVVSDGSDDSGCGRADFVAPDGTPGIDNAVAQLIPILELTEAQATEALLQDTINNGELLILLQLDGLDDWSNDDAVDLSIVRGRGDVQVGANDRLVAGQTFDQDGAIPATLVQGVPLVDGVLEASGFDIALPFNIFQYFISVVLEDARIRLELGPDGSISGYFAGTFDYQVLIEASEGSNLNPELIAALPDLLSNAADLSLSGGDCDAVSITVQFDSTSAFLFL